MVIVVEVEVVEVEGVFFWYGWNITRAEGEATSVPQTYFLSFGEKNTFNFPIFFT